MNFTLTELKSYKSLQREARFEPEPLLGPSTDFAQFSHPVTAKVQADLLTTEVLVSGSVSTVVRFKCDRCLTAVDRPVEGTFKQAFPTETEVIDLDSYVRETILIDLPVKILCDENCRGLCPNCGVNRNTTRCNCADKPAHPGFEALKNFPFH